jgi:hypothetical protein
LQGEGVERDDEVHVAVAVEILAEERHRAPESRKERDATAEATALLPRLAVVDEEGVIGVVLRRGHDVEKSVTVDIDDARVAIARVLLLERVAPVPSALAVSVVYLSSSSK